MTINPQKLKGFRDYLPFEARTRIDLCQAFYSHAFAEGFEPIETPSLEYLETLIDATDASDVGKELYSFKDHGERNVAMRFDLTMPFSRFVAENAAQLPMPFKRVQVGTVWRGEKPQKGRYREFMQADLDIVGTSPSMLADLDLLGSFSSILKKILPTPAVMKINSRLLLSAVMQSFSRELSQSAEAQALIALDKLDKIGPEKTVTLLTTQASFSELGATDLVAFLRTVENLSDNSARVAELKKILPASLHAGVDGFFTTTELLQSTHQNEILEFKLSPSLARGLAYYTGVVFETYLPQLPQSFGSIASGGRYDSLIGRFGKQDLCGVGGSLGVDRFLAALEELKTGVARENTIDVYLALADESAVPFLYKIAAELRSKGKMCEFSYRTQKIGAQIKHAEKLRARYFSVIGETERLNQKISLKNLEKHTTSEPLEISQLDHFLTTHV